MIDIGMHKGRRLFFVGGKSIEELMESGDIIAIPDSNEGIIYKRPSRATPLERAAALTVDEAKRITDEWNARRTPGIVLAWIKADRWGEIDDRDDAGDAFATCECGQDIDITAAWFAVMSGGKLAGPFCAGCATSE